MDSESAYDEARALQEAAEQERAREAAAGRVVVDPDDVPRSKIVRFTWYDTVLRRRVSEDFEIRIMTYKERLMRARSAGLMAGISWGLLPSQTQQYLLAVATSQILWPKASEAWRRAVDEQEDVVIAAYLAVEEHRQTYFRLDDGEGEPGAPEMGLAMVPVAHPGA